MSLAFQAWGWKHTANNETFFPTTTLAAAGVLFVSWQFQYHGFNIGIFPGFEVSKGMQGASKLVYNPSQNIYLYTINIHDPASPGYTQT